MTDREQFIEQIKQNPEDHELKMVFADFLQDKEPDLAFAYRWAGRNKKHPRMTPKGKYWKWHRLPKRFHFEEHYDLPALIFDEMVPGNFKTCSTSSLNGCFQWLGETLAAIRKVIE